MSTYAFYNTSGIINWTNSVVPTDQAQIDALTAQGINFILVPDGTNGSTGMIINGRYVPNNPAAPAIPNILLQYIAAQINNGVVDAGAFHPVTIAQMNEQLAQSNLTAVAIK